jgi:hypothetical protein
MDVLPYIIPFAYLVLLESLTVRWIAGGPVPGLFSRILATNLAGIVLLLLVSMTGWFFGLWPDIRNWALRDSFFLFLVLKAPTFGFLFRRWGFQRIFTLHVLSNFTSAIVLSLLFIYSPRVLGIIPVTVDILNDRAIARLQEIKGAIEDYNLAHGYYPKYLWGGDMASWRSRGTAPSPDPLLKEGYLPAYPVNPLNLRRTYFEPRREPGWRELWTGAKSEDFLQVRGLWAPIVEEDPRFGVQGTKMGNILPDPTMPETMLPGEIRMAIQERWLPGGFFYRSYDLNKDGYADAYIMGVCGDETKQATVDCYDARLDTLTTVMDGQIVPSAYDGIRDGVIYRIHQGFTGERRPGGRAGPLLVPRTGESPVSTATPESALSTGGQ